MDESDCIEQGDQAVTETQAASVPVACPNCGAVKEGRFCAVCGQNDRDYLRSLFPVLYQILGETFETDSRVWRTMRALFLRPGFLSLEFSLNRRARYLAPFRLYLFTSLLFFLVLSLTVDIEDGGKPLVVVRVDEDKIVAHPEDVAVLKRQLDDDRQRKLDEIMARPESSASRRLFSRSVIPLAQASKDLDRFDLYLIGQTVDSFHAPWPVVRDRFLGYLPAAMFFVLPLYALMLKVLYVRRGRFYAEHLVFSMHIHTLVFIVFALMLLTPESWLGWLDGVLALGLLAHYFMALKRFYGTGVVITFLCVCLLLGLYALLLTAMLAGAFAAVVVLF